MRYSYLCINFDFFPVGNTFKLIALTMFGIKCITEKIPIYNRGLRTVKSDHSSLSVFVYV